MSWEIIEGDCLDVMRGMADGSVDAVITDPPYNAINRATSGLRSFDKGIADSAPIDPTRLAAEFVRLASGSIYVWCSDEQYTEWTMAFKAMGLTTRKCAWWKTNPSPMNGTHLWLSALELCVFARKPHAPFFLHCAHPVWKGATERIEGHPTPKPVWLMREQIEASVPEGGVILDPFAGSGTTGVAALNTGRHFIGIERESAYAEVARRRLTDAAAQPRLEGVA
jgi:site-specific DNA-methyltransferase (adenine-specific)